MYINFIILFHTIITIILGLSHISIFVFFSVTLTLLGEWESFQDAYLHYLNHMLMFPYGLHNVYFQFLPPEESIIRVNFRNIWLDTFRPGFNPATTNTSSTARPVIQFISLLLRWTCQSRANNRDNYTNTLNHTEINWSSPGRRYQVCSEKKVSFCGFSIISRIFSEALRSHYVFSLTLLLVFLFLWTDDCLGHPLGSEKRV